MKPFIKCAGNKQRLAPQLAGWAPPNIRNYIEPFCGSASVFLKFAELGLVNKAWLNDRNQTLAWTLEEAKENAQTLINEACALMNTHSKEQYYEVRALDYPFEPSYRNKIASRFLYLNRTCFNGLWRVNRSGKFNVPIGDYKSPKIPVDLIQQASRAMNNKDIMLSAVGFKELFREVIPESVQKSPETFVYFDPPYAPKKSNDFTKYTKWDFKEKDQQDLAQLFHFLSGRGVKCMLSNSDTELIRQLYEGRGYRIETVQMPRYINSKSSGRGKVSEVVIMNYAA